MVTTGPASAEDLLSLLRSREAALEIRRFAARGVLPLETDDQMRALFAVLSDSDPGIASDARATLNEFPPDAFADFLRGARVTPAEVDTIASLTDDVIVLEQVVRHRNVSDTTLLRLARTVTGAPQEALIVNQARLLRNPLLIEELFANPGLTPDGRRMLNELKEEFFEKEARRREAQREAASSGEEPDPGRELPESEDEKAEETPPAREGTAASYSHQSVAAADEIYLRIMKMSVPERVKLALRGGKEERRFLIADSSRMVAFAVLRARGLTMTEVEGFCSMRHLDDEIFYKISRARNWVRRPRIAIALVRNPKVPLAITMPLILRLPMRELRSIAADRNLPEAVRMMAKKTYFQRRK